MIHPSRSVTVSEQRQDSRLPEVCSEGALIVEALESSGVLEEVGARLRIAREGGYCGLDVFVFLLYLLATELRIGIKEFHRRIRSHGPSLAALAGRRRLPTPASVSRALGAVGAGDCDDLGTWLLLEGCEAQELLRHPCVFHRDARGDSWHVFDFDPTRTVLRQRALPHSEELPTAHRRSHEARPGYTGRKRGDVLLCRSTLQHAGSGLWLGLWTAPGNGDFRAHSRAALQMIRRTCDVMAHDRERALIRADGEAGNTPFITACQQAGIRFLTRSAHYEVLEQPEIQEHLNETSWFEVQDSGSGPKRQAAELGWFTLPVSSTTRHADGTPYSPVRARLVVTRFPSNNDRGAGHAIGAWRYELFVTDLLAEAWPAPDVVTAYYGRTGQENRFGQEDRELGLDRILSYHLPGQNLANLVGLFIWNLRTCRGLKLLTPPAEVPEQPQRESATVETQIRIEAEPEEEAPEPEEEFGLPLPPEEARRELDKLLRSLDWPSILDRHPNWTWTHSSARLRCPNDSVVPSSQVKLFVSRHTGQLKFRASLKACGGCPLKAACTKSTSGDFRKEVVVTVPNSTALRAKWLREATREPPAVRPKPKRTPPKSAPQVMVDSWEKAAGSETGPQLTPLAAHLLPAVLRKAFANACRNITVRVDVASSQPPPRPHPAVALDDVARQHRRRTWSHRLRFNALYGADRVQVRLAAAQPGLALLATRGLTVSPQSDNYPTLM